ncbi:MAG: mannose-1-phosphate guanylyltransferase [Polyangiaceae bacterium]|nr:mannose-1-phosphate guanylyltransferase [Polyangiaceae bacterium]
MQQAYAVILAGGSGTRFWPASRRLRPKQLLSIGPAAESSLIATTVERIEPLCPPDRILVATGAHLVAATRAALPQLPSPAFLGEPSARNTAACIGWATAILRRRDPDAVVMVLPSDHHIGDVPEFRRVLAQALASASDGPITTVGIRPTRPETGYGYLELGPETTAGVHVVERFVEKPARARAEAYVASGRFLWNSGMFFFRAEAMLEAIAAHLPELARGLDRIESAAMAGEAAEAAETRAVFPSLPAISIDHGVMERLQPIHVVRGDFGWSDLGSWESAWELGRKDTTGNVLGPSAIALDARNNYVQALGTTGKKRVLVAIGVDDLCIIDTDDALLVIPRNRAQDVRLAVEHLRDAGDEELV